MLVPLTGPWWRFRALQPPDGVKHCLNCAAEDCNSKITIGDQQYKVISHAGHVINVKAASHRLMLKFPMKTNGANSMFAGTSG